MRNILVTGGAGFIGANFIRHMLQLEQNIMIINLDKLTYAGNLANLKAIEGNKAHVFIEGDICDSKLVTKLLHDYEIDTLVNFAAESHVDRSIDSPNSFITTNINGTFTLLEAARQFKLERFHHISTDEVYGSLALTDSAFTEKSTYAPRSPYSASKASSDHLVLAYHHTYGLAVTLSNCSNNYGPYQHPEKFIPTVIRAAFNNQPIPVYGNGKNIRDWLYVDDHCHAIHMILKNGKIGECYNIGGDNEIENLHLAKYICALFDTLHPEHAPHERLLTFVKDRAGHDFRYAIDSSKIRAELAWEPLQDFAAGMQKTIAFYSDDSSNFDLISEKQTTLLRPVSLA